MLLLVLFALALVGSVSSAACQTNKPKVYIFSTPSVHGLVKIGKTDNMIMDDRYAKDLKKLAAVILPEMNGFKDYDLSDATLAQRLNSEMKKHIMFHDALQCPDGTDIDGVIRAFETAEPKELKRFEGHTVSLPAKNGKAKTSFAFYGNEDIPWLLGGHREFYKLGVDGRATDILELIFYGKNCVQCDIEDSHWFGKLDDQTMRPIPSF